MLQRYPQFIKVLKQLKIFPLEFRIVQQLNTQSKVSSRLLKKSFQHHQPLLYFNRHFRIMASCGCGIDLSKEELKKKLTSMQYQVTQEGETERPFSGKYCNHFEKGTYVCIVCNQHIFSSESKFESKCGWPAFSDVVDNNKVKLKKDLSLDMDRTEVSCSGCGAHLGHVFDDGPKPTGKRYCINSAALDFLKSDEPAEPDSTS